MEAIRETTVWSGPGWQPNHIYLMDGSRALAYIRWGEGEPIKFKTPMQLDKRGRTFARAEIGLFASVRKTLKPTTISVAGSRGNVYQVDPERLTCTCSGFTFRGTCKHLKPYSK